jgi:hypothetical protein
MESEPNLVPYLIILLLLLFASVFALFVYSGLFTKIVIRAGPPSFGSVRIAYKFARGPYKNAGQLFTEAHCLAPDFQTIGIYYDDPQQVNSVSSALLQLQIICTLEISIYILFSLGESS